MSLFNETTLENAVIEQLKLQGYAYCHGGKIHQPVNDVLLRDDIKQYLLNTYISADITIDEINQIIRRFDVVGNTDLYSANKEIMRLITDGFCFVREDTALNELFINFINFDKPEANIFRLVNQLEIEGYEKRIPDLIIYINGLPLVVFEFKSAVREDATIFNAHTQLTVRYRRDIPELFKYNAFCVISDGVNNRMGSVFTPYDYFYAWKKIVGEEKIEQEGINSLDTMLKGLFDKIRLLDVIHNFIFFPDQSHKELKIVPRYPQYYAARMLFENIKRHMRPDGDGKGGTYFGATGSGKSFTMLYLTRLLMRSTHFGSPTIILITDRIDLDDQLSEQFVNAKSFVGDEVIVSVSSREDLRVKLQNRKSGGVFLTTIHKFTEDIKLLTDRSNVICISDEAHRSQTNLDQRIVVTKKGLLKKYGFAKYLHDSLPNATYVGFTGTPIDDTLNVFGPIVDSYSMLESVIDKITVRIVYEGRAAKVLLNNAKIKEIEDYYSKCAQDGANQAQINASKKAVTQLDVILGDPKRLALIADDFIQHYEKRVEEGGSVNGKAMLVCSNRSIAWNLYKDILARRPDWNMKHSGEPGVDISAEDKRKMKPVEKVKLVITRNPDDPKSLWDLIGNQDDPKELSRLFKNDKSNFKIVIVVDMWITGFDVPCLDTMYIDKPIKLHSLIQTISRVNRVFPGKERGLVVDYIGIKKNMDIALAKYNQVMGDNFEGMDIAISILRDQLDLLSKLFHKFDTSAFFIGSPYEKLYCLNKTVEYVQQTATREKSFMNYSDKLNSAYNICCSSELLTQSERDYVHFYLAVKSVLFKLTKGNAPDITQMNAAVRKMLEQALISQGVEEIFKMEHKRHKETDIYSDEYVDKIMKIDLPNIKIHLLQALLSRALQEYGRVNKLKSIDFTKRMQQLVKLYNERRESKALASAVLDDIADKFAQLFDDLKQEKNSFEALGIDFEEKAFFDILKEVAAKHNFEYPEDKLIVLSKAVKVIVDDKAKYTDWSNRDDIKADLKVDLILTLAKHKYPPVPRDEVFKEIFEQAENFRKYRTMA